MCICVCVLSTGSEGRRGGVGRGAVTRDGVSGADESSFSPSVLVPYSALHVSLTEIV